MTAPRPATIVIALLLLVGLAWGVTLGLERIFSTDVVEETAGSGPAPPPAGVPRITATLFYGSGDGLALVPVRQEVALAEGAVQQGQEAPVRVKRRDPLRWSTWSYAARRSTT